MFHFALRPVFAAAGVGWKEPPVSKMMIFSVGVFGLFALVIFIGAAAALLQPRGRETPPPLESHDALTAASDRFMARLSASPELRAAFSTADADQARAIGYRLASQGLRRLDDARLVRRRVTGPDLRGGRHADVRRALPGR